MKLKQSEIIWVIALLTVTAITVFVFVYLRRRRYYLPDWKSQLGKLSSHNQAQIKKLHPKVRPYAVTLVVLAKREHGIDLHITATYRSCAEQNALYAQGRTTSGKVVTNARCGFSFHNFGVALDAVPLIGGIPSWAEGPHWQKLGALGKRIGFEWGGDWKGMVDRPHYEMDFGYSLSEFREMVAAGKTNGSFVNIA
jgi:peptidoglycan L-alanyl-D-glutamate endopeptidase CwlK